MKKYQILESWHNRCDNAVCELYAECENENDTREILDALSSKFEKEGLGDGFPPLTDGYELMSQFYDNIADFWLQKNDEEFMSSEYRRRFQVIVIDSNQPKWDFVHEQESLNPAFYGFYTGIISNGKDFLFFRANREDNLCEVFGSIEEMGEDDSELFALCSYPWTAENDSLLLSVLNNTPFEDVYTYGTCDQSKSILKTIEFKK